MINIAVMGYGTVGSGVVEVINTNGARINQRIGEELNIKYVLDMKDFPEDPVQDKIIHDFETIVSDEEVQIVVEVMGGIEPAYTFVKRCLQAGKSVATSNKALVAKHGAELLSIAAEHNINFLFEASVGGWFSRTLYKSVLRLSHKIVGCKTSKRQAVCKNYASRL